MARTIGSWWIKDGIDGRRLEAEGGQRPFDRRTLRVRDALAQAGFDEHRELHGLSVDGRRRPA